MSGGNNRLRPSMGNATERAKDIGKGVLGSAGRLSRTTADAIGNTAASSAGLIQSASQGLWDGTASLAAQLQQLPADAVDALLPECPIPMFIVPIGPDQEDYRILFGLDAMFESLRSGVFVRPKIEAWAATDSGWDVTRLAEQLEAEFNRQFQREQEQWIGSGEIDIKKLEANLEKKSKEMSESLERAGTSLIKAPLQAGFGLLSFNPITGVFTWPAGLVYVGMSLYNVHTVGSQSSRYMNARSARNEVRRELRDAERDLEEAWEQFEERNKAFREAVSNLEVRIHPQLQEFHRLMCDRDRVAWAPTAGAAATDVPDARAYLSDRDFLKKLPRRYRKLVVSV